MSINFRITSHRRYSFLFYCTNFERSFFQFWRIFQYSLLTSLRSYWSFKLRASANISLSSSALNCSLLNCYLLGGQLSLRFGSLLFSLLSLQSLFIGLFCRD